MATNQKRRDAIKTILWGVAFTVGGAVFWYAMVGNPLHDLALIRHGQTAPGFVTDTWEDVDDNGEGGAVWSHGSSYEFTLLDGRKFTGRTSSSGRLRDDLVDLQEPFPIEVEYLPDDPKVSRIKGNGSPTLFDWLWRKVGLGLFLLCLFLAPGITILRNGIREIPLPKAGTRLAAFTWRLKELCGTPRQPFTQWVGEQTELDPELSTQDALDFYINQFVNLNQDPNVPEDIARQRAEVKLLEECHTHYGAAAPP